MASALPDRVHQLLAQGRLTAASAAIAGALPELRRFAAGVFGLAGSEKALASAIDPNLLDAEARTNGYFDQLDGGAEWFDYAAAAVANSWMGDRDETLRCWKAAAEAAPAEAPYVAIAARERHAHHALTFGDLAEAESACAAGHDAAANLGLEDWRLQVAARRASLAVASGDLPAAERFLREAPAHDPAARAYYAPIGVRLSLKTADEDALNAWSSADVVDVALHGFESRSSIAAAIACVLAAANGGNVTAACASLRRALVLCDGGAEAPELFSLAARYGDAEDAAFGLDGLRAAFAPGRPYLHAHRLLARAHWSSRFGKRADAVDSAGDAARAFDAMGFRWWTDEAMNLLVHDDAADAAPQRRRSSALALTGRERQVAHLIRRGASNREVAHTLQISEHTVERHVSSILSRLGLRSRWQIVDVRNPATDN